LGIMELRAVTGRLNKAPSAGRIAWRVLWTAVCVAEAIVALNVASSIMGGSGGCTRSGSLSVGSSTIGVWESVFAASGGCGTPFDLSELSGAAATRSKDVISG